MGLIPGLLTIGIPTFNGGVNLAALLASVGNLGLAPRQYELLIVDNCSADDTDRIIAELKLRYANIRYYKNETNLGRVENWNRVLELVDGEYLIMMNVNDCFLNINLDQQLCFLRQNPDVPLVMNDVISGTYRYPNWKQSGLIDFKKYIQKTFLKLSYPEFNSLGVLQQHVFRTRVIRDHQLRFEPHIARTTDRVFIANVINKGGGKFLYTGRILVEWNTLAQRFHSKVHHAFDQLSFQNLWINEYLANMQVALLADLTQQAAIESQMIFARFLMFGKLFRWIKSLLLGIKTQLANVEMQTSPLFYKYLKKEASTQKIAVNNVKISLQALVRALKWFVNSVKIASRTERSLHGAIEPTASKLYDRQFE